MALLFLDSFDHYSTEEIDRKWTSAFTMPTIRPGEGRCGTAALWMDTFNSVTKGLPFAAAGGTCGFAFKVWVDSGIPTVPLVRISNLQTQHLMVQREIDGSMSVYRTLATGSALLGASAPGLFHVDIWYYCELQWVLDASAGSVTLRVNNVTHVEETGIRTVGEIDIFGAPADATARIVSFSCPANRAYWIEDLYVLDDTGPAPLNAPLGDSRVEYLRPRAAGSSQEWTPVGSPAHWFNVDDNATPDEDSTYVEANVPDLVDTNLYQPTGLPTGNPIFGAQLSLYGRKTEPGPRVIAPVVNGVVGAPHVGVSFESYQYRHTPYGLNPATGTAWTVASINTIDAGVKVVS